MNFFRASRSVALWLIILIFSFTFAQAQNSTGSENSANGSNSNISNNSIGDTEKKSKKESKKEYEKQTDSTTQQTGYTTKRKEFGFWGGTSTVHKDLMGASAGGNYVIGAFRYSYAFKDGESVKLKYFLDLIPVAVLNYPRERVFQTTPTMIVDRSRTTVYGVGVAPGGLQVNFRNHKKYQPFVAGSVGLLYFTKVVVDNRTPLFPRATGAKLNFTGEFGGGLEIGLKNDKSFFAGFKYYHISNFYTGNINIGFNENMIYAGMNFGR